MVFDKSYRLPNRTQTVSISVYVDHNNMTVHILDLNHPESVTLTNGIDLIYDRLKQDIGGKNIDKYHYLCYCTDGVPFRYAKPGYRPVPAHMIHRPFYEASRIYTNERVGVDDVFG